MFCEQFLPLFGKFGLGFGVDRRRYADDAGQVLPLLSLLCQDQFLTREMPSRLFPDWAFLLDALQQLVCVGVCCCKHGCAFFTIHDCLLHIPAVRIDT